LDDQAQAGPRRPWWRRTRLALIFNQLATAAASKWKERSVRLHSSPAPEYGALLKGEPQCNLNQTGLVYLSADYAEGCLAKRETRGVELHAIEEIEDLGTEL
jgi:hypothetical protein